MSNKHHSSNPAHYDFDRMSLNVDECVKVIDGDTARLRGCFDWKATPQGAEYWFKQMQSGLDNDARSTLQFLVDQSVEFHAAAYYR